MHMNYKNTSVYDNPKDSSLCNIWIFILEKYWHNHIRFQENLTCRTEHKTSPFWSLPLIWKILWVDINKCYENAYIYSLILLKDLIVILENILLFRGIMLNFIHKHPSVVRTFIICRTDTCEKWRYNSKMNLFLPYSKWRKYMRTQNVVYLYFIV